MSPGSGFEEFVAIVDCGSFTSAAEHLGLPRPTLSRRLARLEERLNVRLLHRTTRRVTLTHQGEQLYAKARRVVLAAREAESEVRRLDGVARGLLRVSTPLGIPHAVFAEWIADLLHAHPEMQVEVVASSEHVDLVAEGFDVALRGETVEDDSLVARVLLHNAKIAVASPKYLAEHGVPDRPEALEQHNCILGYRTGTAPELRWPLRDGGWIAVSGTLTTNQTELRLEAAKRHLGIALVVDRIAADALSSGELEVVLDGIVGRDEPACLVYPDREYLDPKVRAFVDLVAARLEAARIRRGEIS